MCRPTPCPQRWQPPGSRLAGPHRLPGRRDKLKFCGATLAQRMFWVPQSGDVGLGVFILSYGRGVQSGVITDSAPCRDPQKIIDEFVPEFGRLSLLSLMLPWGDGDGVG